MARTVGKKFAKPTFTKKGAKRIKPSHKVMPVHGGK